MTNAVPTFDPHAPPFPDATFAAVVSLGGNCEPAHWLRIFGRHAVHGPFDWLVTPLDALPAILAEDGARLGVRFALAQAGRSVRCRVYGVLYHHEFPRGAENAVVFDAAAMAACRSKLAHKWTTLVEGCARAVADSLPMLFLRLGGGTGLPWDRIGPSGAPLRAADLNAVAAALTARFPDLDVRMLVLLPTASDTQADALPAALDSSEALDARIVVRRLPRGGDPAWAADGPAWQRVLAALRFGSPAETTALGETLHWSGEVDAPNSVGF